MRSRSPPAAPTGLCELRGSSGSCATVTLYVRSVNGTDAAWYRGVQSGHAGVVSVGRFDHDVVFVEAGNHVGDDTGLDETLDEAYRAKYGRWGGPVERITAQRAQDTTLRLDPA